jgi:ribonuclease-3 family protein
MNPKLLTGADLAFIGDAYYELYIRTYIINQGITNLEKLHKKTVSYVSRDAQSYIIEHLIPVLSIEEIDIYKRGRNYNYKTKTHAYITASGFEALIGYLYLTEELNRLEEILKKAIAIIEDKE